MKDKIAKWYRQGLWTAEMVKAAIPKGLISVSEYAEITGKDYI